MEPQTPPTEPPKQKPRFNLDLKIVVVILLLVIVAMLILWKPWVGSSAGDRTIEVTGTATVKAEPDEYVFNPSYEFSSTDKDKALKDLTAKSDVVVAELKKLGVADSKIKTNAADYGRGYFPVVEDGQSTYSLSLTVTVTNKELAQKVQDYLVTTSPSGQVTPLPNFSTTKQKELEAQARTEAEKDARAKAEQSAKNIGFKLGKVKSISDATGFGDVVPLRQTDSSGQDALVAPAQLTLQPGENELSYSVTAVYYIK